MPEVAVRPHRPILLVGLMGSGKSTVGARLAERLGLPFVDSDREVEKAEGMPVAAIFDRLGEPQFRRREREVMSRLAADGPRVIAAGGGAFADADLRRHLLEACTVVWLDGDSAVFAARLGGADDRPLLRGREPAAVLAELAGLRRAAYAEAHHRLETDRLPPDEAAERLAALLAKR